MERGWKVWAVFFWWGGCSRPGRRRGRFDTTGVLCPDSLTWAEKYLGLNYTPHQPFLPGNMFFRAREEPRDYCLGFKNKTQKLLPEVQESVITDTQDEVLFPVK